MGGKDDSSSSGLDRWLDTQRAEVDKIRRQFEDSFEKEIRNWQNDASPTSQPSTSSSQQQGPFERFKSFIDTNLSTFATAFRDFPANVSDLKAKMQQELSARRGEERDIWRRWTGSEDSPDHIRMQIERQSADERQSVKDATYLLLRESYERNKHVPAEKILKLYKDPDADKDGGYLDQFAAPMLSFGGACYYKSETVDNLPSTARLGSWLATPKPQWLSIEWFKRSPYSPIRLEADPVLQQGEESNPHWRAAFEDLLSAALDKPLRSIEGEKVGIRMPYGKPQSTYKGPGLEWMLSLQCRGILPPQLPSLYKPVALFDGFDEVKRPRTVEFMHDLERVTADDKTARVYPLVKRDLKLLMEEVGTKSGPATEALPLPLKACVIPQSSWRVPDTEEELYEEMVPRTYADMDDELYEEMFPRSKTELEQLTPAQRPKEELTHYEIRDFMNSLRDAIRSNDAGAATRSVNTFIQTWGEVPALNYLDNVLGQHRYGLIGGEPLDHDNVLPRPFYEVFCQVLKQSQLSDSKVKILLENQDAMEIEKFRKLSPLERLRVHELLERADIVGCDSAFEWRVDEGLYKLEELIVSAERMAELREHDEPAQLKWFAEQAAKSGQKYDTPSTPSKETASEKGIELPDILSQLTTTQTTRSPDGTVTTKVVLKRRFADGSEETHETLQTTKEGQGREASPPQVESVKEEQKPKEKKGWFWN